MASANEAGVIRVVCKRAGNEKVALQFRSDSPINAGKSPDGVLANLTIDKWMRIGFSGPQMTGGDKILLRFAFDGTDGLDVSDGVINIPYWEDGVFRPLTNADFVNTTDIPAASLGEATLGTGYIV